MNRACAVHATCPRQLNRYSSSAECTSEKLGELNDAARSVVTQVDSKAEAMDTVVVSGDRQFPAPLQVHVICMPLRDAPIVCRSQRSSRRRGRKPAAELRGCLTRWRANSERWISRQRNTLTT